MPIELQIDGSAVTVDDDHATLLEVLREQCGITSVKDGCAPQGQCGCCTVLVEGRAVSGCLYLAVLVDGAKVVTIEQPAADGGLDRVQQAFVETGAFQCGFCTPGFVLMARQLLEEHPDPTEDDIRHYLSGNLCRCATYPEIIEAVKLAARRE